MELDIFTTNLIRIARTPPMQCPSRTPREKHYQVCRSTKRIKSYQAPSTSPSKIRALTYPLSVTLHGTIAASRLQPHTPILLLQPKLLQLDPRHDSNEHQHTRHNHRPVLYMRHIQAIRRPARRTHSRQTQRRNDVPRSTVVLPHGLRLFDAPVQTRRVVLRKPYHSLEENSKVKDQPQDSMRRGEVLMAGPRLVNLDDDETGEQGGETNEVEEEVDGCADALLLGGVRRLEDQRCLSGEEQAGGIEERVRGEEDEFLGEDGAPDDGGEDPDSGLGDGGRACGVLGGR